jgi:zinc/manganese transport system substrate-binding protein
MIARLKIAALSTIAIFSFMAFQTAKAFVNIIAAENVYGEVAKELGGPYINVISIINSPTADPHLFSITPSTAKAVNQADIIIYNGANYDPWMQSILTIQGRQNRAVIEVASIMHIKEGENPHIWYLPETMPTFAKAFGASLIQRDPEHQLYYDNELKKFNNDYQVIFTTVAQLKKNFQNTPVIATEPVFGYMAKSIGLQMRDEAFQISMMNDVPPTVSQIKQFTDDLQNHRVKVLIYNNQVIDPLTQHMRSLAEQEGIPVIGVSEMLPMNITYIEWMKNQLANLKNALEKNKRD